MSPEKQRIAIAEACGFGDIMGNMGFHQEMSDEKSKECGGRWRFSIPDYLSDLNAMHEACKNVLQTEEAEPFMWNLVAVMKLPENLTITGATAFLIHATSTQRAEAFLRTIGKWEDDA